MLLLVVWRSNFLRSLLLRTFLLQNIVLQITFMFFQYLTVIILQIAEWNQRFPAGWWEAGDNSADIKSDLTRGLGAVTGLRGHRS